MVAESMLGLGGEDLEKGTGRLKGAEASMKGAEVRGC